MGLRPHRYNCPVSLRGHQVDDNHALAQMFLNVAPGAFHPAGLYSSLRVATACPVLRLRFLLINAGLARAAS